MTKKVDTRGKKYFPESRLRCAICKNGVQIGKISPLLLHLYFTAAYRGLPPCTLSHHPDNREMGYSNVLEGQP